MKYLVLSLLSAVGMVIGIMLIGLEQLWSVRFIAGVLLIYWTGYFTGRRDKESETE